MQSGKIIKKIHISSCTNNSGCAAKLAFVEDASNICSELSSSFEKALDRFKDWNHKRTLSIDSDLREVAEGK